MATKDPSNFQQWEESPANQLTEGKSYFAVLKTNLGDIKIELDAETRPVTVNNFVFLSKEGFYDGVIFHRIIPNFMAQGGDPTGTGMGGPGYQFEDEIDDENSNAPYTISMANAGPGTNGSQFFINFVDNGYLNTAHTVFGTVIEGKEVVDTMNGVQTDFKDKPVDPIVIQSVVIEEV
ncbi:peptidylprolyl isomerase [Candidatus Dojkabacteria bacterium]|uniref:Peptidyl-prolyl cis-trans isomerase n=1 Tax=Candidatus Dojkabacteria bacterium TaxID=2099670 RepID=A0A955RKV6_9BACT|nr:peptidylprolyl isomerase [Candidatus Dojkabacteria bacterium]